MQKDSFLSFLLTTFFSLYCLMILVLSDIEEECIISFFQNDENKFTLICDTIIVGMTKNYMFICKNHYFSWHFELGYQGRWGIFIFLDKKLSWRARGFLRPRPHTSPCSSQESCFLPSINHSHQQIFTVLAFPHNIK